MQALKKFYFGKQKAKVNTYIGGIGGTINTPALLASRLGISESRIKLFKVTGVDVECAVIGGSYSLGNNFTSEVGLTYFRDMQGLVSQTFGVFIKENFSLTELYLPKATKIGKQIGNYAFENTYGNYAVWKVFYAPLVVNWGDLQGYDGQELFRNNFINSITFYLHPSLQTSNAGGVEGDIAYGIAYLGFKVRYVTNFTPPNTITNLSVGTIYNAVVQLNFTPPTSVNGVDFYECYANGKLMNEIKNSGEFITGLTPSTNYNIRIVAVDMFYNKSELSNTVNVSTFYNNSVDADATNYTNISGNSSFSNTIQSLFIDLKNTGLYNKIQAFYPFLGTTAAQHKWNAKNPLDTNAAFRLQFFGGGTHSNLGYQCNGANAYANTFLVPSAVQNVNSNGLTITVGTNNNTAENDVVEIGSLISATQSSFITTKSNNTTFRRGSKMNGVTILQDNQNDAKGIFTSVKQSSTVTKLLRNKLEIASGNSGGTLPTVSVFIGNMSLSGSPYTYGWSNQRIQFTAIHEGLTDAEVIALHTIINNFETAIGRKTW